jgi:hypothetical protein
MKIMVFLHGTAIMHRNALGHTRLERVQQVLDQDESIYDFASYVPVDNVVRKLRAWKEQGTEIVYLSSQRRLEDVEKDKQVLEVYGFPEGLVFFRSGGEEYKDVAERALPDVLIEDDCESIGGEKEMTYPNIRPELKAKIKSIVIKEFGGLDHLLDKVAALVV